MLLRVCAKKSGHAPAHPRRGLRQQPLIAFIRRDGGGRMAADEVAQASPRVEPEKAHAPEMHHHRLRPHLRREIERAARVPQPLVVLVPVARRGRRLEQIGGRMHHARRQRTEIVRRTDLNETFVQGLEDARHEGDADAVAQLHVLETHPGYLLQHRIPIRVARRAPCGRKRENRVHRLAWRLLSALARRHPRRPPLHDSVRDAAGNLPAAVSSRNARAASP